ncbi:MAG: hypothetical protein GF317_15895 [Candidatus Lokiarchaeota archaeon]|nr:hypothetical protein [Candidatus Lokiarchaeota archaeon]MBD3201030.1 hypothetical protein [Candidatus Lokiarchaeota archaeon]
MKLLISPKNVEEAKTTIDAGVEFIDCKNPEEGSLGANFPWIIKRMKELIPSNSNQLLSATIGDFPYLPGSASLAAFGAAKSGADIIKVGLKGPRNEGEGIEIMKNVVKAVRNMDKKVQIVTAGYADKVRMNTSLEYLSIPVVAHQSGSDIAMLDTFIKDGKGLFDFLSVDELLKFKELAEDYNLKIALAGNLRSKDLGKIKEISPEIIGIRSAVCQNFDRNKGKIKSDLIINLKKQLIES